MDHPSSVNDPIVYTVELHDLHAHLYRITLSIPRPQADQTVSLPVWVPGSYLVREFARHVSGLRAFQGRREVAVQALDKTRWKVSSRSGSRLELIYLVYAFDTSVRTAYLDAQRGFFNGTSLFLRIEGAERRPHHVKLPSLPKTWRAATAMPARQVDARGRGEYSAPDYDELVDHPFELGAFWRATFQARGVEHELVVSAAPPCFDGARLLADTQRICETEIRFWHGRGKPPFKRYVFLLNAMEDGYGGLEHRASTALIASRKDLPREGMTAASEGYTTVLGLISHEYFHTWNVKRLKPAAFAPYDYTRENHTELLWFFEGFTSYYDDLLLLRAGLVDPARYLRQLVKNVNHVLATPGRRVQSVAQASWDAWTKYYRPDENTANATVSYYTKGALVALCTDLSLRLHGHCLDEVMLALLGLNRPLHEDDILEAVARLGPASLKQELWHWVHGTEELPVFDLLEAFGIEPRDSEMSAAQRLGFKLQDGAAIKVVHVLRGGLAEAAGVAAQDELIAVDGWRVKKSEDLQWLWQPDRHQQLLVARDQRVLHLSLLPQRSRKNDAAQLRSVQLVPVDGPSVAQTRRRDAWLTRAK